jgi:nudix-type nucleoside diphosphatase (YffH/AdpP family)
LRERHPRRVEVVERERVYSGFFALDRAVVRYERFDGTMSEPLERLSLERGDAVGILLHDPAADQVVLVEQFRYAVHAAGEPGWLVEIPAGMLHAGEDPEAVARAEVLEETGYEVRHLEHLVTCYLSPGGSSERIYIYAARISLGERPARGGGLASEGEDTRLCILTREEARQRVQDGRIRDAKTIIALQAWPATPQFAD